MTENRVAGKSAKRSVLNDNPPGTKITIIYDNYPFDGLLETEWGFSCFIEGFENRVLFDTPGGGKMLISNMQKLRIDPKRVDTVFLSHDHADHVGGLQSFLAQNEKATVYLLKSFSKGTKSNMDNSVTKTVEITNPAYLCRNVATTGELGVGIKEQSLALETKKGAVIITGCAHPGIVSIIRNVKETLNQRIHMVLGGFHLGTASDVELEHIVAQFQELGVEMVGPCHCSGERCRKMFRDAYGENFVEIGVGRIIQIE